MRRLLLALLASLFIATPVFAAGNTVYIYESDGQIYYDGSLFDDRFIIHEGMTPGGEVYTDYLTVENGTSKDYDVYFKITSENNTARAENIIDHVEMRIYIDDVLYYDGKARGLDYIGSGVNLTDAVKLKHFDSGDSVVMKVETYLDVEYEDIDNPDTSRTHWHFYLAGEAPGPTPDPIEPEEIQPNPRTNDDFTVWYFVLLGASVLLFVFITIRERSDRKKRD